MTDGARYLTPDDAVQVGYEAVASISETPVRRPYAPGGPIRHAASFLTAGALLQTSALAPNRFRDF
jgi:hypothetical protein